MPATSGQEYIRCTFVIQESHLPFIALVRKIDVTSEEDFQDGDKYTTVQAFASVVSAESEVLCV